MKGLVLLRSLSPRPHPLRRQDKGIVPGTWTFELDSLQLTLSRVPLISRSLHDSKILLVFLGFRVLVNEEDGVDHDVKPEEPPPLSEVSSFTAEELEVFFTSYHRPSPSISKGPGYISDQLPGTTYLAFGFTKH